MHTTQVSSFALWYGGHSRLPHRALTAYNIIPYTEDSSPPTIDSASWSTQINSVPNSLIHALPLEVHDIGDSSLECIRWFLESWLQNGLLILYIQHRARRFRSKVQRRSIRILFHPWTVLRLQFTSFRTGWGVKQTTFAAPPTLSLWDPPMKPSTSWNAFCKCKASIVSYPLKR